MLPRLGRRGRLRVRRRGEGVEVLGWAWSRPVEVVQPIVLLVGFVGATLALEGPPGTLVSLVMLTAALLAAWGYFRLVMVLGLRRRRSRVVLGAEGVELSGTDGRGLFPWDVLTGVDERPLRLLGHGPPDVRLPARELLSDPALVARLVERYQRRPSRRGELADHRVFQQVAGWDRTAPTYDARP